MASWYLYSDDGRHLGPVPTEYVARAVKSGAVPRDRWVTEADRTAWRPIRDVREIMVLLESGFPAPTRDRETTMIATAEAFPSFAPAPSTQKDVPSSNDPPSSSDRTVIAPTAFDEPSSPAAPVPTPFGYGYGYDDGEATIRALPTPKNDPFGATLRSPDSPPGVVPRPAPQIMDPPPAPRIQTPLPPAPAPAPTNTAPPPVMRSSGASPALRVSSDAPRRGSSSGGPVVVFFLGGLAMGAIVVVAILVWAFRGGLLTR